MRFTFSWNEAERSEASAGWELRGNRGAGSALRWGGQRGGSGAEGAGQPGCGQALLSAVNPSSASSPSSSPVCDVLPCAVWGLGDKRLTGSIQCDKKRILGDAGAGR